MDKSWWPTIAGILNIVTGSLGIINGLLVMAGIAVFSAIGAGCGALVEFVPFGPILLLAIVIPFVLLNIVSIVGGVCALNKKRWRLALAGSITTFFVNWVFGAAAVVFIGLSRSEFDR